MDNYPVDQEQCSKNYWSRFQYSRDQRLKQRKSNKVPFWGWTNSRSWMNNLQLPKNEPKTTSLLVEILSLFGCSPLLLHPPHLHGKCEQIVADYHVTFMIQYTISFDSVKSIVSILNNYLGTSEDIRTYLIHSNLEKRNRVITCIWWILRWKLQKFGSTWLFLWIFWWNLMEEDDVKRGETRN